MPRVSFPRVAVQEQERILYPSVILPFPESALERSMPREMQRRKSEKQKRNHKPPSGFCRSLSGRQESPVVPGTLLPGHPVKCRPFPGFPFRKKPGPLCRPGGEKPVIHFLYTLLLDYPGNKRPETDMKKARSERAQNGLSNPGPPPA